MTKENLIDDSDNFKKKEIDEDELDDLDENFFGSTNEIKEAKIQTQNNESDKKDLENCEEEDCDEEDFDEEDFDDKEDEEE